MANDWVAKNQLHRMASSRLRDVEVVLDIGCGIRPQRFVRPKVHIMCEPHQGYVERLQESLKNRFDLTHVVLKATWAQAIELVPPKSVDSVFLVDVIEHLPKSEGQMLLSATEKLARAQIAIFTPLGFMPQHHPDGVDNWGMDGGAWQEHKSGWTPEDFDESWDILKARDFHERDHAGVPLKEPFGAFWAIKDFHGAAAAESSPRDRLLRGVDGCYSTVYRGLRSAQTLWKRTFGD